MSVSKSYSKFKLVLLSSLFMLQSTIAIAGGLSDGGGLLISPAVELATSIEIYNRATDLAGVFPAVLNRLEARYYQTKDLEFPSDLRRGLVKMFGSESNSQKILQFSKRVKVVPTMTEDCFDLSGKPVDASINIADESICLSVKRIVNRIDRLHLDLGLMSLFVHELSHVNDCAENEAIELQKYYMESAALNNNGQLYIGDHNYWVIVRQHLEHEIGQILHLKKLMMISPTDQLQFCFDIRELEGAPSVFGYNEKYFGELSAVRGAKHALYFGIDTKLGLLAGFCSESEEYKNKKYFQEAPELQLADYLAISNPAYTWIKDLEQYRPWTTLRWIRGFNESEVALKELDDLEHLFREALSDLDNNRRN